MKYKFENSIITFRKLKLEDYKNFKILFKACFKRNVSYNFYKWRYFSDKLSFCYGAFCSSKLIANVGMVAMILNNGKKEKIFSRHSSMVLEKFRGKGIFSILLKIVKKNLIKDTKIIVMWPNINNHSSFGLSDKNIIRNKYYLYKTNVQQNKNKNTLNCNIKNLHKLKNLINRENNFFLKNFNYFKKRYLSYKHNDYLINKFEHKKLKSFFVLKKNKYIGGSNYVVLDHFGSIHLESAHLSKLINDERKIIFWSKKKIYKKNYDLVSHINVNIGLTRKINNKKMNKTLVNAKFMLGDTDSFVSIN